MKRGVLATTALFALAGSVVQAQAQENPSCTWNCSANWKSPYERAVDLDVAEAQMRARQGGYGPGQVVTTYNGTVTTNNEYNGTVNSSSATTATNLNSFTSTVNQEGSGTASVNFRTGSTAYNTNQNATAANATSEVGDVSNHTDSNN